MQSLLREAQVFLEQISFVKKSTVSNLKRLEMFLGIFSFSFFFVYLIFKESQQLRLQCGTSGLDPWVGKIPWRRAWQPTPVFLPGESSWTEKPSGLQSVGSQRVRHDWAIKHTHKTPQDWTQIQVRLYKQMNAGQFKFCCYWLKQVQL